ncbi:hypothetical protein [Streptomyces sp. NBC_01497]|uniref:hypothetical protein n=1 Tax=Streptomyces sp. NBC_01497 TaxID=2903885 RepID=UPI002E2F0540|nr:hypothetical protein [Streptomyces sp. NBC_01497]
MTDAPIVVHRVSTGGRGVTVRGEIVGLAHSDRDLALLLDHAGLPDADSTGLLDDPDWIEWRGERAHEWGS